AVRRILLAELEICVERLIDAEASREPGHFPRGIPRHLLEQHDFEVSRIEHLEPPIEPFDVTAELELPLRDPAAAGCAIVAVETAQLPRQQTVDILIEAQSPIAVAEVVSRVAERRQETLRGLSQN